METQTMLRRLAWLHAGTRTIIATGLLLGPIGMWKPWLGDGIDSPGGRIALRSFGVRDAVLGLGILHGLRTGRPVRRWFQLGVAAEFVDAGLTMRYRAKLPDRLPTVMAALGAAGAVGGLVLGLLLEDPPEGSGSVGLDR